MNVLLAGCFLLYSCKNKSRNVILPGAVWLGSASVGMAIMLLIPRAFHLEGNRTTGYRTIHLNQISEIIASVRSSMLQFAEDYSVITGVLVCVCALITLRLTCEKRKAERNKQMCILASVALIYLLLNEFLSGHEWHGAFRTARVAVTLIFIMVPYAVWIIALWTMDDFWVRNRCFGFLLLSGMALAPFLVVSPSPIRVAFMSHVFLVCAVLVLVFHAGRHISDSLRRHICLHCYTVALCAILVIVLMFVNVKWLADIRENHIVQQMENGATEIEIFQIPYGQVFWDSEWCFKKLYYYQERGDILFVCVDLDTWLNTYF